LEDQPGDGLTVAFVNSSPRWGGNEKWTRLAAEGLAESHRVHLISRAPIFGQPRNVTLHKLPFLGEADLATLAGLAALLKRHRIDVVIPTRRKDYGLTRIAARFAGTRTVMRLGIARSVKSGPIQRWLWGGADGIVVNSIHARDTLLASPFIQPSRVRVVYNGVDFDRIDRLARAAGPRPFKQYFSTMGELSPRKRMNLVIEGFARFAADNTDSGLVLIGEGPEKENLVRLASRLGVADRVGFLGFLSNPYPVIAGSEAFILASTSEGIPNAVLEAMALARPIVASRASGLECIRHGQDGFLLDPFNPEALAGALSDLAPDSNLRQKLGESARKSVLARFSLDRMRDELEAFFMEVLHPELPA
jgi:glycosyltransferase involved in cell wall biosynthesis